ncbi:zinc metalloproteinase nas-14-like [Neocloeon triangulifer]|uniref:zinc metalloproteinase nas-14-like n=1 Tax=Neocloeon triangulifer TaxID=2078957 RepID=UPI00286EC803|nr:zinc metalloproteinase nas-14-like [Neocloeon triangulifer]
MLLICCLFLNIMVRCTFSQGINYLPPIHHGAYYPDEYDHDQVTNDLMSWHPYDVGHPWELSGLLEGDIMESPEKGRNVIRSKEASWPGGVIPYVMQPGMTQDERQAVDRGMELVCQGSCITFRPYQEGDKDYIVILYNMTGCWSYVGRQGGGQVVSLHRGGCYHPGTVAHEFLHATGFYHQQSAADRDGYVYIDFDNIEEGHEHNFDKKSPAEVTDFGVGYDYSSVMHYSRTAFSKNGEDTIIPFEPGAQIGQREKVSKKDFLKLNRKYKCKKRPAAR